MPDFSSMLPFSMRNVVISIAVIQMVYAIVYAILISSGIIHVQIFNDKDSPYDIRVGFEVIANLIDSVLGLLLLTAAWKRNPLRITIWIGLMVFFLAINILGTLTDTSRFTVENVITYIVEIAFIIIVFVFKRQLEKQEALPLNQTNSDIE